MRVLVVEDDADLARQLQDCLSDAGYAVDLAPDGEEGHYLGANEPYDAVVLDLGLPIMDGISVLESWRRAGRQHAGADPDRARPLERESRRVRRRRRRLRRQAVPHGGGAGAPARAGPARRRARHGRAGVRAGPSGYPRRPGQVDGRPVRLTAQEYRLLAYLMHHQGRVVSRTELTEHLYDQDFDRDSNIIEVFVGRLRKKLGIDVIETVRGLGYRLRRRAPPNAP